MSGLDDNFSFPSGWWRQFKEEILRPSTRWQRSAVLVGRVCSVGHRTLFGMHRSHFPYHDFLDSIRVDVRKSTWQSRKQLFWMALMRDNSPIEWTEATWNPVTGCDKVSPGCAHCYAEAFAERFRGVDGHPYQQGFDLKLWPQRLEVPLKWRRPRTIFVNSMSDLFHEDIPTEYIQKVFEVMATAGWHTFQVLTKRQERLAQLAPQLPWPPNIWMGVSVENRRFTHRLDYLRTVPAAVRFVSAEPLLGPLPGLDLTGVDWLIAGGESGHRHRPARHEWIRELRDLCLRRHVPFFFKQWGGRHPKAGGRLLDGQEWSQLPEPARHR